MLRPEALGDACTRYSCDCNTPDQGVLPVGAALALLGITARPERHDRRGPRVTAAASDGRVRAEHLQAIKRHRVPVQRGAGREAVCVDCGRAAAGLAALDLRQRVGIGGPAIAGGSSEADTDALRDELTRKAEAMAQPGELVRTCACGSVWTVRATMDGHLALIRMTDEHMATCGRQRSAVVRAGGIARPPIRGGGGPTTTSTTRGRRGLSTVSGCGTSGSLAAYSAMNTARN